MLWSMAFGPEKDPFSAMQLLVYPKCVVGIGHLMTLVLISSEYITVEYHFTEAPHVGFQLACILYLQQSTVSNMFSLTHLTVLQKKSPRGFVMN